MRQRSAWKIKNKIEIHTEESNVQNDIYEEVFLNFGKGLRYDDEFKEL